MEDIIPEKSNLNIPSIFGPPDPGHAVRDQTEIQQGNRTEDREIQKTERSEDIKFNKISIILLVSVLILELSGNLITDTVRLTFLFAIFLIVALILFFKVIKITRGKRKK